MKKINVLQVVPTLGYGGVAKVVLNYYKVIDHDKYHFDFITHGGEEDFHSDLIHDGCKLNYFLTIGKIGFRNYISQIKANVSVESYDVVHIHTGDITGVYAKAFKMCGAKKVICHAHTTKAVSKSHILFERILRHMALKYSDCAMACGYEAGDYCFGKNKYIVLPNGIDFDSFNSVDKEQIEGVRASLGIPNGFFVVGHVGFFSPPKNHYFLFEIAKSYVKLHPNSVFVFCGKGPRFEDIKRMIEEEGLESKILLTGVRNDINVLFHLFNVFVLPSLHEGLPVVGIEAQTSGLMCLISDKVDHQVDIGCNLCQFISIDQGISPWIQSLESIQANPTVCDPKEIREGLKRHNYDIVSTRNILTETYNSLSEIKG